MDIVEKVPEGWIPRKEAAGHLSVHETRVKQLVDEGRLDGVLVRVKQGRLSLHVPLKGVLEMVRRGYPHGAKRRKTNPNERDPKYVSGRVTAQVFKAFRGGASWHEVIEQYELTPVQATALWDAFSEGPAATRREERSAENRALLRIANAKRSPTFGGF